MRYEICQRCGTLADHTIAEHPRLPLTAAAHRWYVELDKVGGRTFINPRYTKYPRLHVLRLEDAGLVDVKRRAFDEWFVQRVDRMRT